MLCLHVRLDVKIFVWIEEDVSMMDVIFTLLHFRRIQQQFYVRVHFACTVYTMSSQAVQ